VGQVGGAGQVLGGVVFEQLGHAPVHDLPAQRRDVGVDGACEQVVRKAQAMLAGVQHAVALGAVAPTRKKAVGRQCEYAVFGCRSLNRDPLPLEAGHLRTTAVAAADFLGGVSEGQVSG